MAATDAVLFKEAENLLAEGHSLKASGDIVAALLKYDQVREQGRNMTDRRQAEAIEKNLEEAKQELQKPKNFSRKEITAITAQCCFEQKFPYCSWKGKRHGVHESAPDALALLVRTGSVNKNRCTLHV